MALYAGSRLLLSSSMPPGVALRDAGSRLLLPSSMLPGVALRAVFPLFRGIPKILAGKQCRRRGFIESFIGGPGVVLFCEASGYLFAAPWAANGNAP